MDENDEFKVEEAAVKYMRNMTVEQFLEWADKQEEAYEFVDGEIFPVTAARPSHNILIARIVAKTGSFLEGKKCQVYSGQQYIEAKARYSYFVPDASIFCEELESAEVSEWVGANPTVVIEVLSPSTASFDMGKKFFMYMQIQSLKEFLMIDSREMEVTITRRKTDGTWKSEVFDKIEDKFTIESIGLTITLKDLYTGINFKK
jgi:Uma2 family endonuclease